MPSITLIIKANNNPIFESISCGDTVHGELVHTCHHLEKVLVFHRNKPAGLFVHMGCESINLAKASWLSDSQFARLKSVLEDQSDVCTCDDSGVFRKYGDASPSDRKEYRRIEELVARVTSEKNSRKQPPAPKLMPVVIPPLFDTRGLSAAQKTEKPAAIDSVTLPNTSTLLLSAQLKQEGHPATHLKDQERRHAIFGAIPTPRAKAMKHVRPKLLHKVESFAPQLVADKIEKSIKAAEAITPSSSSNCGAETAKEHKSALYTPKSRKPQWGNVVSWSKDSHKHDDNDSSSNAAAVKSVRLAKKVEEAGWEDVDFEEVEESEYVFL